MNTKITIVVADDDDDDQMLVKEAIDEVMDCDVTAVYNGIQLMDYLLKQGRFIELGSEVPDFILLDLNMPLLDGFGVLAKIRKNEALKHIPIYILSTSRMDHDRKRSSELGANGFYTKPILYQQLKEIIQEITKKVVGQKKE